jgi:hypothetical protein
VPAPERLRGIRVVADPATIDGARWHGDGDGAKIDVIRFAPDEALAIAATSVDLGDAHAIVEAEIGFVALVVDHSVVEAHTEWPLPAQGGFAQGSVAGVPAKVSVRSDGRVRIITQAAYAAELEARLT